MLVLAVIVLPLSWLDARPAAAAGGYTALAQPVRYLDTRPGPSAQDGREDWDGLRGPESPVALPIAGRLDVPGGVSSVVLNVTVTGGQGGGYVTVYPCDGGMPDSSSLNFSGGDAIANNAISRVSGDGSVCFFVSSPAYLIVDVAGYFASAASMQPLARPLRLLDSRSGPNSSDGREDWDGVHDAGAPIVLPVAGRAGVPSGVVSAVLNVTVTGAQAAGYVTVYPCDGGLPNASNLNYERDDTVANNVIARLAADGTVCLFASGATHLIVDVSGYFPTASVYAPLGTPARVLDSRFATSTADHRFEAIGARSSGSTVAIPIAGRVGVPSDATAVVLNVTATGTRSGGYVSVFPPGAGLPGSSNLNYGVRETVPNSVIARVGASGVVCVFTEGVTDLVVDVAGYLGGGGGAASGSSDCADPSEPTTSPIARAGTYSVASQLAAGRYRATMDGDVCTWQRKNGLGLPMGLSWPVPMIGPVVIDLTGSESSLALGVGCGRLRPYAAPSTPSTLIAPGYWVVKSDIAPGKYRTYVSTFCTYVRVSSFDGNYFDEDNPTSIDGDTVTSPGWLDVTIASTDAGFITTPGCGVWSKIG